MASVLLVPREFSWFLDGLNVLDCPPEEELRCHFGSSGSETAAAEVPKYVCAGEISG